MASSSSQLERLSKCNGHVGVWENGVMKEEHLFWDNQTYAKQIGLQ
jgi:hypothetical protein